VETQVAALEGAAADHLGAPLTDFVDAHDIERLLSPAGSVAARDSQGGPAPAALESSLSTHWDDYEDHEATYENLSQSLEHAETALAAEVADYV